MKADIVLPVYGGVEETRACIESIFAHSGSALGRLIAIDDRGPEPEMAELLETMRARWPAQMRVLRNERNLGFVASVNRGLAVRRGDAVLLNSDTVVTAGWLQEMLEVAESGDRICAVVPLSNNATFCSVPEYGKETPAQSLTGQPLQLEQAEPRATPLATGVGFCLLLRNRVLNMIGGLDPAYGRGYHEENDWCARAQQLGFVVMRANRALVYHRGSVSFGGERRALDERNAQLLWHRYPYYVEQTRTFDRGPEARVAASYCRRRLKRLEACVEVSHLGGGRINGTGVYAVELVRALKQHTEFQVSVRATQPAQRELFGQLGVGLESADPVASTAQVFHRPAQIFTSEDLNTFLRAPGHAVISYLDLIAFRAPSVFSHYNLQKRYRALSHAALHSAQAVIALSEHNRREIIDTFHLPPERVRAVPLGVDAEALAARDTARNREVLARHAISGPYFLCAGSDYAHKNLKLLLAAYARYRVGVKSGAPPSLVLCGPPSRSFGSLYDRTAEWPPGVRYLGELPEDEVKPVFQEALAFVYPSAYEGFGLPPLEAMACGVPVICSTLTSLPEVVGDAALPIRDFAPEEIAGLLAEVEQKETLRQRLAEAGRARAAQFTWKRTAERTAEVYLEAIDRPPSATLLHRQMTAHLLETLGPERG